MLTACAAAILAWYRVLSPSAKMHGIIPLLFAFLCALGVLARDLYWVAMNENEVAQQIVDSALRVHPALGPGLSESVYPAALAYELEKRTAGHSQAAIPVIYAGDPH
jgi:hypothetical protein